MSTPFIRCKLWNPEKPGISGPDVTFHRHDVVAVSQTDHDFKLGYWRSRVYLRDGSQIVVDDDFSIVERWYLDATPLPGPGFARYTESRRSA